MAASRTDQEQKQTQAVDVFDDDIRLYLSLFCEEQNIDDMKKESQSVWNGCLRYIMRHVFSDKRRLKSNELYIYNNNIPSNFNSYNYDIVNYICDIYIDLCCIYDKEISIVGFSNLTGINVDSIHEWGRENARSSSSSFIIYKKLHDFREESLSNKLVTGKQNPVGVLGVLNRHYQWNMPGVRSDSENKKVLTAQELPRLDVPTAQIEAET